MVLNQIEAGTFQRGLYPAWDAGSVDSELPLSGLPGWQSNGSPGKAHPAHALPFTLSVKVPEGVGRLQRVHLVGIFGIWGEHDEDGAPGALVQLRVNGCVEWSQQLLAGRHYATPMGSRILNGDGISWKRLGRSASSEGVFDVEQLTVDVPGEIDPDEFIFRDLGTPASFVIFDALFEFDGRAVCPFRGESGNVSLGELGSVVRMADRYRFAQAVRQLRDGICATSMDLDEARGQALTFLAVVAAALLEMGGPKQLHRAQLEAARAVEILDSAEAIAEFAAESASKMTEHLMGRQTGHHDPAVDRALAYVDRNFARDLSDTQIAFIVGLSTSHFRYLFKLATDQPFHKYLINLRLEKARLMLSQTDSQVAEIARNVGFGNAAHFTRAFTKRFAVPPSSLRPIRK